MQRWCLRLQQTESGEERYGDVLYKSHEDALRAAEAWNSMQTGEHAEPALHPDPSRRKPAG